MITIDSGLYEPLTLTGYSADDAAWFSLYEDTEHTIPSINGGASERLRGDLGPDRPRVLYSQRGTNPTESVNGQTVPALLNPSTAETFAAPFAANFEISFTVSGGAVDSVGIVGHEMASKQIDYAILADYSGFTDVVLVSTQFPTDNNPIYHQFAPVPNGAIIKIRFFPPAISSETHALGFIMVGRSLVLPRGLFVGHTPPAHSTRSRKITFRSESGRYLGQVLKSTHAESEISISNAGQHFYRRYVYPWVRQARDNPFLFAWRPVSHPTEVAYSWATGDHTFENQRANGMVRFSMPIAAEDIDL